MLKIGVIHATCNAVSPLNVAAAQHPEDITILNFVNENLLYRANQVGGADEYGLRSFTRSVFEAIDANVDGIIIACTVYTPFVDLMKNFCTIPIIGIDNPMLTSAVNIGGKIGVLATTASSGPSAKKQLLKIASEKEKDINVEVRINTEGMTQLKKGNIDVHNRILYEEGKKLVESGCSCIVLAQITMACAAAKMVDLGVPILTSPSEGIKEIVSLIQCSKNNI